MALTPGPQEIEFNNWYDTKFKPAMERGPLDKYVARQAWFAAATPLLERIAALTNLSDRLKLEAQTHAMEARTANATIAEIYRVCSGGTGEPGNWHGAEPVRARIAALEDELETERIRLAACGVVAMSDTPESAAKQRQMLPKYWSASCGDVVRRVDECMELRSQVAALTAQVEQAAQPIDMVLHCPACGMQHVDAPSPTDGQNLRMWSNPPHKSHLCRPEDGGCGHIWRPADVPTNGVAAIKTKGKADSRHPAPCTNSKKLCGR